MISYSTPTWDIFCKVVDNYGDVGVCWRLARQLAEERGQAVRLWCDDLAVLAPLCPGTDPTCSAQRLHGVEVRLWPQHMPPTTPGEVVIEAFACDLPEDFIAAMAARPVPPVWINLEYLTAEVWAGHCHRLASPHPRLPLLKHFFFPGFVAETGGLLRESDLLARRDAVRADPAAAWARLALPVPGPEEVSISLFAYENAALPALLDTWAHGAVPVRCLVRPGRSLDQIAAVLGGESPVPGKCHRHGSLGIHVLPFVAQEDFDLLLWLCELNFVRGEDSFVRAQWAARPMVWHIYPQDDNAHRLKLAAFLDRYCADMPGDAASASRIFWDRWNHGTAPDWESFWRHRAALAAHAERWAAHLAGQPDLATALAEFVESRLKSRV